MGCLEQLWCLCPTDLPNLMFVMSKMHLGTMTNRFQKHTTVLDMRSGLEKKSTVWHSACGNFSVFLSNSRTSKIQTSGVAVDHILAFWNFILLRKKSASEISAPCCYRRLLGPPANRRSSVDDDVRAKRRRSRSLRQLWLHPCMFCEPCCNDRAAVDHPSDSAGAEIDTRGDLIE